MSSTDKISEARQRFSGFLRDAGRGERLCALHDTDADGLAAGVIWQRALERADAGTVERVLPDRSRSPWTADNRARLREHTPDALFVLDLGSRPEKLLEAVPTCYIDHHRPDGVPEGDVLISAYGWEPTPSTSLLMWELARGVADVTDLDWIAAVGIVGDLGDQAPFDLLQAVKEKYTAKWLKEATVLVNAARRGRHYAPERAARALLEHNDPHELATSKSPDVAFLREARQEFNDALNEAKSVAPVIQNGVALIRLHSPCQVHPVVAQIWSRRLEGLVVIAANEGYLPGRVNFSARGGPGGSLIEFLRSVEPPGEGGSYAQGHDAASGGSLPLDRWNALLRTLGFSDAPPDPRPGT